MNGKRYTMIPMGWFGNQDVTVIFEDGEIGAVLWDDVDVYHKLTYEQLEEIKKDLYEDPLNGKEHTDALIKLWKEERE